mmetsp:Transcript_25948/g.60262  ORF Transcript_25948/g.60262 Transcript_25948/m.60262 type:complete len:279 (-) Transcript_25948:26-862(-)
MHLQEIADVTRLEATARASEGLDTALGEVSLALDGGTAVLLAGAVHVHEALKIELGALHNLDLAHVHVLDGVDGAALLGDLSTDGLGDELVEELAEVSRGGVAAHDLHHAATDLVHLSGLGVGGLALLVALTVGERNGEHAHGVAVGGLDVHVGLDEGLPLADQGSELVAGHVHAVEVAESILALDLLADEAHLAVVSIRGLVEVAEGDLEHAVLHLLRSDLLTSSLVDGGLAGVAVGEESGGADVVPFLAGEGVDGLLLAALLLAKAFVLADSHGPS